MKRRQFMQAAAGGMAAAATYSMFGSRAKAAAFGEVPHESQSLMLPESMRAHNILEVFLYGGVSPWESFYCNPDNGRGKKEWLYTFIEDSGATTPSGVTNEIMTGLTNCGYPFENSDYLLTPWKTNSKGEDMFLGPWLQPLFDRPDVLSRMRVVVNRHTLEPHEAAIPLAVTGKTLGSPSAAALGTHVARYFVDRDDGSHASPFSYGFATAGGFIPNDNVLSVVNPGLHIGAARPLLVKVDNVSRLSALLGRGPVGNDTDRATYDELMGAYFSMYDKKLKFGGAEDSLRAAKFRELLAASRAVSNAGQVQEALPPELFDPQLNSPVCGYENGVGNTKAKVNVPEMSLRLATHLLTHPTLPAKHCCVVDTGVAEADGGGGYDTHRECPTTQSRNLNNTLTQLLARINKPGENNPNKIDLNKTMVILNQEFGRTPWRQGAAGRNHWPYGYMQVYFGGPITTANAGYYGSIKPDGNADIFTTPTENRIASLLAMGIWPFDQLAFSNSDVQGQSTDAGAVKSALKRVLGIEV